jgi:hypothetical protein
MGPRLAGTAMSRTTATVLCAIVLACPSLAAHHSYAGFFLDRTVVVEGYLEGLKYANPHVMMRIRATDSTVYTVTWEPATWLERYAGVQSTTFKVGDRLIISAAPSRDPHAHELGSVSEVRRPRDGWDWKRADLSSPHSR